MGRFTKNAVAGKADEARSGWRARQEQARQRASGGAINRAEIAAVRAAYAEAQRAEEERGFNPEVKTAGQGQDFVSALTDADLVALYKQLHDGRAPAPKAKRPAIERAVRAKQEDRAKQVRRAALNPVDPQGDELPLDQPGEIEDV